MSGQRRRETSLIRAANDNLPAGREVWHDIMPTLPITQAEVEVFSLVMNGIVEPANDNNPPPRGIAA
jgi:hypothetical protein